MNHVSTSARDRIAAVFCLIMKITRSSLTFASRSQKYLKTSRSEQRQDNGQKKTESPWKIKPVFRDFLPHWFTFKIPECLAVTTLSIRGGNWIEKLETKKNSAALLDVLRTSSRKVLGKRKVHPGVTLSTERAATAQAFVLEMKYAHCFFTTLERSF